MGDIKTMPSNRTNLLGIVMNNLFNEIDDSIAVKMINKNSYAQYSAWEFFATVWLENNIYYAEIRRYRNHVDTLSGESLNQLMEVCSEKYGNM